MKFSLSWLKSHLDTNASLKEILGALSATTEEGSWISSSYLVAEIVVIPIAGFMATVFSRRAYLLVNVAVFLLAGCQTAYYATMAKFGWEKRDLLKKAVLQARNEQKEAQTEFKDALTRLREMYQVQGGNLEKQYDRLKADFDQCATQAKDVRKRIKDMDQIATDLFAEWEKEIGTMSNTQLVGESRKKLAETKAKYAALSSSLTQAEVAMDPVLKSFHDHVLYLKHNLNAAAIGSLKGEATNIQAEITRLINQMNDSISQADSFIKSLQ